MEESAISFNNIPIRIPIERWEHIVKRHQLEGSINCIILTISNPEAVYIPLTGFIGQYMARSSSNSFQVPIPTDNLVVHYREISKRDGFIITAHLISNKRFKRMIRNWKKVYPLRDLE